MPTVSMLKILCALKRYDVNDVYSGSDDSIELVCQQLATDSHPDIQLWVPESPNPECTVIARSVGADSQPE